MRRTFRIFPITVVFWLATLCFARGPGQEPTLSIQVNVNESRTIAAGTSFRDLAGLWGNDLALKLEQIPKSRCSLGRQGGNRFAPAAPAFPEIQRGGRSSRLALVDLPVTLEFKANDDRLTAVTMRIFSPFYQTTGTSDVWHQLTHATDTKKTRIECTQGLLEELRASTFKVNEGRFQFEVKQPDGVIASWVGELDGLGVLRISRGDFSTGVPLLDQVAMRRIRK